MDGWCRSGARWLWYGRGGDECWERRRFVLVEKEEGKIGAFLSSLWEKSSILPAGTTIGGGLGAMRWGAGGMGTTLTRGAGIMGGICVMTCPGARRTTGATGGLGITGTADNKVVRTEGATCRTGNERIQRLLNASYQPHTL